MPSADPLRPATPADVPELVRIINTLADAMSLGKGKEELGKVLHFLAEYTGTHFKMEEKYFVRFASGDFGNSRCRAVKAAFETGVSPWQDMRVDATTAANSLGRRGSLGFSLANASTAWP